MKNLVTILTEKNFDNLTAEDKATYIAYLKRCFEWHRWILSPDGAEAQIKKVTEILNNKDLMPFDLVNPSRYPDGVLNAVTEALFDDMASVACEEAVTPGIRVDPDMKGYPVTNPRDGRSYKSAFQGISMEYRLLGKLCDVINHEWCEKGLTPNTFAGLERDESRIVIARFKQRRQRLIDDNAKRPEAFRVQYGHIIESQIASLSALIAHLEKHLDTVTNGWDGFPGVGDQRNDIATYDVLW